MNRFLTVVVSTSALIVALSTAYYLIVFIPPRREATRSTLQQPTSSSTTPLVNTHPTLESEKTGESENVLGDTRLDKEVKSGCVNFAFETLKKLQGAEESKTDQIFLVNTAYRICLARAGLPPEDLLSDTGSSGDVYYSEPVAPVGGGQPLPDPVSPLEDFQQKQNERQQEESARCQKEMSSYNICLSDYNSKMLEYNSCMAEKSSNPYKFCSKPIKFCYKPLCSY